MIQGCCIQTLPQCLGRDPRRHFELWTSPLEPSALKALARLGHQVCAHPSGLFHPVLL